MLRFFRKLRHRLLTENRFGKYLLYTIGEVLLVVIGILIALQVDNWNEERTDRLEEQRVLLQLKEEFLDNRKQIGAKIALHQDIVHSCQAILQIIDQQENPYAADSLNRYLAKTLIAPTFDAATGVVSDLINSGKLYLIRNDSLRHQVSGWEGNVQAATEEEIVWRKIRDEQYGPFIKRLVSYRNIVEMSSTDFKSAKRTNFGNAYEPIAIGFSKIASSTIRLSPEQSEALEDQISSVISLNHVSKIQMAALQERVDGILEAIEREQKSL